VERTEEKKGSRCLERRGIRIEKLMAESTEV
jgi:hypothetical protein